MKGEVNESLFSRAAVAGLLMGASVFASAADALKSEQPPEGAKVFIVSPPTAPRSTDLHRQVRHRGIALKPAGDQTAHSGHHHLLVDVDKAPVADMPLPTSLMPRTTLRCRPATGAALRQGADRSDHYLTPGKLPCNWCWRQVPRAVQAERRVAEDYRQRQVRPTRAL
jgi:hypothetical protein